MHSVLLLTISQEVNVVEDEDHYENDVAEGQDRFVEDWNSQSEGNQ